MSTWSSEVMSHGTLVVPTTLAKKTVETLGHLCKVQFLDMNENANSRPFRRTVGRIDETQRQLRVIRTTLESIPSCPKIEERKLENFMEIAINDYSFEGIEATVDKLTSEFEKFEENNQRILADVQEAIQQYAVTRVCANQVNTEFTGEGFTLISGTVKSDQERTLQMSLNRVTFNKHYSEFNHVDHIEGLSAMAQAEKRSTFVIILPGSKDGYMYQKVARLVAGFDVCLVQWPGSAEEAKVLLSARHEDLMAANQALEAYDNFFLKEVEVLTKPVRADGNALLAEWQLFCEMEKATFAALDLMEPVSETLRCDLWYPSYEREHIYACISRVAPSGPQPFIVENELGLKTAPTFFRNTGFTVGFQSFVNTYGTPRNRELNPAVVTCVTLPFLFGIMYGDIGHGFFVLLAGLLFILLQPKYKNNQNEMVQMMLGGRYMIFLMGIYAVYAGFLYNDVFSVGLDLFGTKYQPSHVNEGSVIWIPNEAETSFPYPFGFDPVWKGASNELTFANSFKMKFSIVIAGLQMGLGIVFRGVNQIWVRDKISFIFEFLPMMIFFGLFVGYLCFMIIFKWVNPGLAPGIINMIIEFAMMGTPLTELYDGQTEAQIPMVYAFVGMIPIMLVCKPVLNNMKYGKIKKEYEASMAALAAPTSANAEGQLSAEEVTQVALTPEVAEALHFDFGEEFIHQLIEVIEFCLGAVSNTASYLRLWALSLAHQQLALVFYEMILFGFWLKPVTADFSQTKIVLWSFSSIITFGVFAGVTTGVMLMMDSLECYLHALRLQWVEFQSKFFHADGIAFRQFSYHAILKGDEED